MKSLAAGTAVCLMSWRGVLMASLPGVVIGSAMLACAAYLMVLDFAKVPVLRRLM